MSQADAPGADVAHLRRLAEGHNHVRELLFEARTRQFPPHKAFIALDELDGTAKGLLRLNAALMDYYEQIAPMRRQVQQQSRQVVTVGGEEQETDLWVQTVYKAEVPKDRTLDTDMTSAQSRALDHMKTMSRNHTKLQEKGLSPAQNDDEPTVTTTMEPVSLESLSKWRGRIRRHDVRRTVPHVGTVVDERKYRLLIPIEGAAEVYSQLNDCLEALNLLADVKTLDEWTEREVSTNGR